MVEDSPSTAESRVAGARGQVSVQRPSSYDLLLSRPHLPKQSHQLVREHPNISLLGFISDSNHSSLETRLGIKCLMTVD